MAFPKPAGVARFHSEGPCAELRATRRYDQTPLSAIITLCVYQSLDDPHPLLAVLPYLEILSILRLEWSRKGLESRKISAPTVP